MGRPTTITPAVQDQILEWVSNGKLVKDWCKQHRHVPYGTVFNFMGSEAGSDFRERFAHARESGTHFMAEDTIRIADDKKLDPMRARLMVDTRLRLIGQWNRRVYGPKQDTEVTVKSSLGDLVMASLAAQAAPAAAIEHKPEEIIDVTPRPSAGSLAGLRELAKAVMAPPDEPSPPAERRPRRTAAG